MKMQSKVWSAAVVVALVVLSSSSASAFCGFYVGGAGAEMFNNATEVVLMREGTTTVLSMQNNYQGPPKDFAMVVPVPVVLKEKEVKVIGDDVFAKVDKLGAPRLVEYWEQDPCPVYPDYADEDLEMAPSAPPSMMRRKRTSSREPKVKIEAQFDVGEYNVVILSAKESNALEAWLVDNEYNIPSGAAGVLKGYIEQGFYFFVAKVDAEKVTFDEKTGSAMLSPLRFHYDSESFFLPVRLGLLNAKGPQDLIVSILGPNQRYEVANAKNVAIPTNLHVDETVKESFAEFYVSLFDYTMKQNPGAVVTEYSWQAMKCDPCPDGSFRDTRGLGGALNATDLATLGADVLGKPEDMNFGNWCLLDCTPGTLPTSSRTTSSSRPSTPSRAGAARLWVRRASSTRRACSPVPSTLIRAAMSSSTSGKAPSSVRTPSAACGAARSRAALCPQWLRRTRPWSWSARAWCWPMR